jgi:hypothetical protein
MTARMVLLFDVGSHPKGKGREQRHSAALPTESHLTLPHLRESVFRKGDESHNTASCAPPSRERR